jgi:peptidoglycan hydrolase-like protein with peptidoglycan-binding domain
MDIRKILDKLDTVALAEAITIKDVEAAVAGKSDEQERANILNDIAWKEKLPGLYDPVSGYFVPKQGQPNSMGGKYNIAATATSSADKTLADMGLVPQNAKTSTALGRMFRGDDKGEHDSAVKGASDKVNKDRQTGEIKAEKLPKLKALVDKLKAASGSSGSSTNAGTGLKLPGMTGTSPSAGGLKLGGLAEGSIFESLLKEFQDEIVNVEEETPAATGGKNKDLVMQIQAMVDELKTIEGDKDIDAAIADAEAAIKADADAEKAAAATAGAGAGGGSGAQSAVATSGDKEAKLKRIKELLAKAKAPATGSPAAAPKTESMSELMNRIQRIAEGTTLSEALTADEYKELQRLAADVGTEFKDDPEIQSLTKQALALPAQFASDTATTDKPGEKKPVAGADPAIQKVQEQLKALGVDPGPIDGKMGPKTVAGIKAFEKMAGKPETGKITPELSTLLADGKNIVARSKLTQSLAAIEGLMTKYKISESITEDDLESMTEDELRSFVLANIKVFSESEQMSIMKEYIAERSVTGGVDLPANFGQAPRDSRGNPYRPGYMGSQSKPATAAPAPGAAPAAAPAAAGTPSWLDKAKGALSRAGGAIKGAVGRNPKIGAGLAVLGLATAGFGLGKFMNWLNGGDVEMDPADKKALTDHLKVLEEFGKNPEVVTGLPADVKKRLETVLGKLDKLQKTKAKEAPAAPGQNQAAAAGNVPATA